MSPEVQSSAWPPLLDRRFVRELGELSLVALAFLLYFVVRAGVVDRPEAAFAHARDVVALERSLGLDIEPDAQDLVLDSTLLVRVFNADYFWLDFPLISVAGLVLYFHRRRQYTFARDAILFSGGLALIVYYVYPVAPPRLLAEAGVVDTLERYSNLSYQAQSTQFFVNPFAAVPSLHVGWAVLLSMAVVWAFPRNRVVLALAVLHPLSQWASTVVTGNHFVVDGVAGVGVAAAGVLFAVAMQRWGYPRLRRALGVGMARPEAAG